MSNFVIYLSLKPYIRQYFVSKYGIPIKFEAQSIFNDRLVTLLQKRPKDAEPEVAGPDLTPICIPYSRQKDPESWNYISKYGKQILINFLESVVNLDLWKHMNDLCADDSQIQLAACDWCSRNGIDISYADTFRMRFYRKRKLMMKKNIDLRLKRRNRSGKTTV